MTKQDATIHPAHSKVPSCDTAWGHNRIYFISLAVIIMVKGTPVHLSVV